MLNLQKSADQCNTWDLVFLHERLFYKDRLFILVFVDEKYIEV